MPVARIAVVSAALALAACAGGKAAAPPAAKAPLPVAEARTVAPTAKPLSATGLELFVEPESAEVFVEGETRGVVSDLSSRVLGLAPGIYQVSLQAPGYVTWRAEVAVRSGREKIEVRLSRKEPAAR